VRGGCETESGLWQGRGWSINADAPMTKRHKLKGDITKYGTPRYNGRTIEPDRPDKNLIYTFGCDKRGLNA